MTRTEQLRLRLLSAVASVLKSRGALQGSIGLLMALLIVPIQGHLVLLDLTGGPLWAAHAEQTAYGSLRSAAPVEWVQSLLGRGGFGDFARILPLVASFPVGMLGIGRLLPHSRTGGTIAGIVYVCNPFVFDRLAAGQGDFLLGYAVLPFFLRSVLELSEAGAVGVSRSALLLTLDTALSIHFLVIGFVILGVVTLVGWSWGMLRRAVGVVSLTALISAYFLVPLAGHAVNVAVGAGDLEAYRTTSDPTWGLYVNVLGLYGFWRRGPLLPKDHEPGWPILLAFIILICVGGMLWAWRNGLRRHVLVLMSLGAAGFLLALGSQGPTGALYRLLLLHVPGFGVMREAQKWDCLLALAYAFGVGAGVRHLQGLLQGRSARIGAAALCAVVPLAYSATIFGGLDGQIRPVAFPTDWERADQVMGNGPGNILFLPWQQYSSYPWTRGQVIANPAVDFFHRKVISGDDVGLPQIHTESTSPRSAYLEQLFAAGPALHEFGHLVAQLGIRYVVLVDAPTYTQYDWLYRQVDLSVVYRSAGITVLRNDVALPQGARLTASASFPSVQKYIQAAQQRDLRGVAAFVGSSSGPWSTGAAPAPITDVSTASPDSYRVGPGPPGWVVVPKVADSWWHQGDQASRASISGAAVVQISAGGGSVSFVGQERDRIGDLVSLATLPLLALVEVGGHFRRRRRPRPGGGDGAVRHGESAPGSHLAGALVP